MNKTNKNSYRNLLSSVRSNPTAIVLLSIFIVALLWGGWKFTWATYNKSHINAVSMRLENVDKDIKLTKPTDFNSSQTRECWHINQSDVYNGTLVCGVVYRARMVVGSIGDGSNFRDQVKSILAKKGNLASEEASTYVPTSSIVFHPVTDSMQCNYSDLLPNTQDFANSKTATYYFEINCGEHAAWRLYPEST